MRTSLIVSLMWLSSFSHANTGDIVIPSTDQCSPPPVFVPEGVTIIDPVMCESRCITEILRLTGGMNFGEVYAYCSDVSSSKVCVSRTRSSSNLHPLLYPTIERGMEYGFFVVK